MIAKLLVLSISLFSFTEIVFAQQPVFVKKWDKRFGGPDIDWQFSICQSSNGSYILGGESYSTLGGDKTEPSRGSSDYWIVKVDSQGNKQWDKRFGGSGVEDLHVLLLTRENGIILGGISNSNIGGDKSEPSRGGLDYWIVKTDSSGSKQWDRTYGGLQSENLWALQQTTDGGYILGGYSNSGIGGDKTEENWDPSHIYDDAWVVKVDSLGNKQWDKRLGGSNQDGLIGLVLADGGGYVLACYSASDSSGDKTENSRGFGDYWIVKIDSIGNKEWDKTFGGNNVEESPQITRTHDGGYLIGGSSYSGIGGDVTSPGIQWFVKVDANGNKIWDKGYSGGVGQGYSISLTKDGGFLIACETHGPQGPDKSEPNLGPSQTWVIKTDSLGNKQWDKTIFTPDGGLFGKAIEANDGCYVVGLSVGKIGGYVTESNRDPSDSTNDYWVMKFCWEIPNSASAPEQESGITVYPNPFTSDIAIAIQSENLSEVTFTISNIQGQVVFQKEENNLANHYTKMLDLSYLPNGVYLVEVVVNGERMVRKVVKE